jgi:glycine C-acetyltransferase
MAKLDYLKDELESLKRAGLYGEMKVVESGQGAWVVMNGARMLNLCSNNYLGLANHDNLKAKVKDAVQTYGVGASGARLICGTTVLHRELEKKLAHFKRTEDTLIYSSGWDANIGAIQALVGKGDVIFSDELNHGSLIDACRLSGAEKRIYPHKDTAASEKALKKSGGARRRLIVTDGVFSMDGDIAPLPEIVEVADSYDALIMVDDAHGEGVLGSRGRGLVDHFGMHGRVDVEMGTMSKAFGVIGGYITGSAVLVDYLRQRSRTSLLATAPTIIDMAAGIAAIQTLEDSGELVDRLWDNTRYFKAKLSELQYTLGESQTPIIPVLLGDEHLTQDFENRLLAGRIFAHAIVYPTVPKNKARLRLQVSAVHSKEDLDFALEAFERIGREMGILH